MESSPQRDLLVAEGVAQGSVSRDLLWSHHNGRAHEVEPGRETRHIGTFLDQPSLIRVARGRDAMDGCALHTTPQICATPSAEGRTNFGCSPGARRWSCLFR